MKTLNLILSHTTEAIAAAEKFSEYSELGSMENTEGKSELYNSQRSFQTLPVTS